MAKYTGGHLDHAGFLAIKEQMTADLAAAIQQQLEIMGDDAKGISWFSSVAQSYARAAEKLAA